MPKPNKASAATSAFILFAAVSALGLITPRHATGMLSLAYISGFFAYVWFCLFTANFSYVLGLGILCRLVLFFKLPGLSDDVYRFLWDGYLLKEGISPFVHLPVFYMESGSKIPGLTTDLYQNLNSPEYFSIYPPFNQFIFWASVQIGSSWLSSANIIRAVLCLADVGSFFVLRKLLVVRNRPAYLAAWYFLNPLVIVEFTGNLHFEGLVTCFLLSGLYFLYQKKHIISGAGFGMAIATKLLPLIFLPALLIRNKPKTGMLICSVAILVALVSFLPMLDEAFINGIQSSLSLYIQRFEFNASVYFLIREIGYFIVGYNMISVLGPLLAGITFILISWFAWQCKKYNWRIEKTLLFTLTIYLLLATTVHPWYTLPLVAFGLLSGFYFPIVWSLMIFVTYFGYTEDGFELSAWWIVLEYIVVFFTVILELILKEKAYERQK